MALVIEDDELIRNDDGEIIGYEGEGKAILLFISLGLVIGFGLGVGFVDVAGLNQPQEPVETVSVSDLPEESEFHRVVAAARTDEIVDRFCQEHGFPDGYPSADLDLHLFIRCFDDGGAVERSQEFGLFDEFQEYVMQGDSQ